ncbi:MAG: hypothetical protein JW818_01005 [Pirellulales bacterium]|nr:hypothetical protein [Pirellulales bacterium]
MGLVLVTGCDPSHAPPEKADSPRNFQGKVDTSLPAQQQAKQQAIITALTALQRDSHFRGARGVRVQESPEVFLDGALDLLRWDFDGSPNGNDVPVRLWLQEPGSPATEREVRRTYRVVPQGNTMVITRAKS